MNSEEIREYCLAKPGVTEGFPFDEQTLVFKVMNKMYALVGLERVPLFINLKCDPERAIELREQYEDIQPGYHMNKVIMTLFYTVMAAIVLVPVKRINWFIPVLNRIYGFVCGRMKVSLH